MCTRDGETGSGVVAVEPRVGRSRHTGPNRCIGIVLMTTSPSAAPAAVTSGTQARDATGLASLASQAGRGSARPLEPAGTWAQAESLGAATGLCAMWRAALLASHARCHTIPMGDERQAVVLIHGIGEQRPMDTLRAFVSSGLGHWKQASGLCDHRFDPQPTGIVESDPRRTPGSMHERLNRPSDLQPISMGLSALPVGPYILSPACNFAQPLLFRTSVLFLRQFHPMPTGSSAWLRGGNTYSGR